MNARLQIMVDSREIEAADARDGEIIARWRKAVATHRDAAKDLGPDSRLILYYQAGLQAATALVRSAGFRVLGADHHRHTFEALRALDLGELSTIARVMNAHRRSRHQAIYDWDAEVPDDATPSADLEALAHGVSRMLTLGRDWLASTRPTMADDLEG